MRTPVALTTRLPCLLALLLAAVLATVLVPPTTARRLGWMPPRPG